MANEYRFKSGAEREDERSDRERKRDKRIETYGTNIPNARQRRAYEREERRRQVIENGIAQGIPEEEIADYADRALGLSGSATPRLDRQAYEQEQIDKRRQAEYERTGFRTEGDRATYRTQKALRKLMNMPSAAVQFAANIDKSVALGGESALNTEAGLARAYEQGTRAGYNREQIDQMIGRARQKVQDSVAEKPTEYTSAEIVNTQRPPLERRTTAATPAATPAATTAATPAATPAATETVQGYTDEPVTVEAVRPRNVVLEATTPPLETAKNIGSALTATAELGAKYAPNTPKVVKALAMLDKVGRVASKVPVLGGLYKRSAPIALAVESGKALRYGLDDEYRGRKLSEFESLGGSRTDEPDILDADRDGELDEKYAQLSIDQLNKVRESEPQKYVSLRGVLNAMYSAPQILSSATNLVNTARAYQRAAESDAALETAKRRNEQVQRLLRESRPDYAEMSSEDVRALSREDRAARAKYLASLRRRVTAQ